MTGAANMSGQYNSVNTIIMNRQPLHFYTQCGAHRINLIAYSLDNNINIRKALRVVHDLGLLYDKRSNSGLYIILIITKQIY